MRTNVFARSALECGGKRSATPPFLAASEGGVALRFPPHSKAAAPRNETRLMKMRQQLSLILATAALLALAAPLRAQMIVTYGFTPSATVPDNGQITDPRTLGGFASYSNVAVNLSLSSPTAGNPMFLADLYSTLTMGLPSESERVAVLLNRPGRNDSNPFGSDLSSLNVTLDDSAVHPNIWGTTSSTGIYNSDGRLGVNPNGPGVAFQESDRTKPLSALNGAALPSNRFNLLVADTATGGIARLDGWGLNVTGSAAASGTMSASEGTMSIGDTGAAAANNLGATVVTTQPNGAAGTLVVNIAGTMTMSGGVSGTSGLTKQGGGLLTINSAGTYAGATVVAANGGTLEVGGASGKLSGTTSIAVNTNGTLLLSGAGGTDTKLNNLAPVTLAGGTIDLDGMTSSLDQTVGALTLSANSILDLGTLLAGNTWKFAPSNADWSSVQLNIFNYTGGADHLFFGTSTSGLDGSQLDRIMFFSDAGMNSLGTAQWSGGMGEITPVPEPATWAAGLLTVAALAYTQRRCRKRAASYSGRSTTRLPDRRS